MAGRQRARPARQSTGSRMPHAGRTETQPRHATARVIRSGLQAWTAARARATSRLPLFTHARVGTTDSVLGYSSLVSPEFINH